MAAGFSRDRWYNYIADRSHPPVASAVVEIPEYDPDHVYAWKPANNYKGWKLIDRGEAGVDDAEVIQATVDFVSDLGVGKIVFQGTFNISNGIKITNPDIDITLEGGKFVAQSEIDMIKMAFGSEDLYNPNTAAINMKDIVIDGNKIAVRGVGSAKGALIKDSIWQNVRFVNFSSDSMCCEIAAMNTKLLGCTFKKVGGSGDIFGINPYEGTELIGCYLYRPNSGNMLGTGGVVPATVDGRTIEFELKLLGCTFISGQGGSGAAFEQGHLADKYIKNVKITECHFINTGVGFINPGNPWENVNQIEKVIISNCQFYGEGISIDLPARHITIDTCQFKDANKLCINTWTNSDYGYIEEVIVSNCTFENSNMQNSSIWYNYPCISLHGYVKTAIITGCKFKRTDNLEYGTPIFIKVNHSGDTDFDRYILIKDCEFEGTPSQSNPIRVYNYGYLPKLEIENCRGVDISVEGTYMDWKERTYWDEYEYKALPATFAFKNRPIVYYDGTYYYIAIWNGTSWVKVQLS